MLFELSSPEADFKLEATRGEGVVAVRLGAKSFKVSLGRTSGVHGYTAKIGDRTIRFEVEQITERSIVIKMEGERIEFRRTPSTVEIQRKKSETKPETEKESLVSPMPGKVVSIRVKEGQPVRVGDPLVILESMKMESVLRSDRDATVKEVLVPEGRAVKRGQALLLFESK